MNIWTYLELFAEHSDHAIEAQDNRRAQPYIPVRRMSCREIQREKYAEMQRAKTNA